MSEDATSNNGPEIVTCPHCGNLTPKGIYCANCGRALARQPQSGSWFDRQNVPEPTTGGVADPEDPDLNGDAENDIDPSSDGGESVDPLDDQDVDLGDSADGTASSYEDDDFDPYESGLEVIDGEVLDDTDIEPESRLTPALERTRRFTGSIAKAVSIGGAEGDPIYEALERRGRRPTGDYRRIAAAASLAVLVALLLNNAGIAILLSVFIVPILLLLFLTDLDLFEREPWPAILGALGAGAVIGLIFGTISAWLTGAFWIEGATFYAGAAGYGARFAEAEGTPPIGWIALGGVIIPAIVVIACAIAPVFLRRWPVMRNEVMDGVTLGAAAGSGYAAATAVVHYWPAIVQGQNPGGDVSDWSATLVGLIVLRPLIYGAFAAILCASIWQYAIDQRAASLTRGVVFGVGGIILFSIVDLLIQPAGAAAELLWHLVVIVALWFVTRSAIRDALRHDALAVANSGRMVQCENCGRLTPDGLYCAHCGATLASDGSATVRSA